MTAITDSPLGSYWKFSGRFEVRTNPRCRCGMPHVFKVYVSPEGTEEMLLMMPAGTPIPAGREESR